MIVIVRCRLRLAMGRVGPRTPKSDPKPDPLRGVILEVAMDEGGREIVVGSNIKAEVAAEGSSEDREVNSNSEVEVFLEGRSGESEMSVFSENIEESETSLELE